MRGRLKAERRRGGGRNKKSGEEERKATISLHEGGEEYGGNRSKKIQRGKRKKLEIPARSRRKPCLEYRGGDSIMARMGSALKNGSQKAEGKEARGNEPTAANLRGSVLISGFTKMMRVD